MSLPSLSTEITIHNSLKALIYGALDDEGAATNLKYWFPMGQHKKGNHQREGGISDLNRASALLRAYCHRNCHQRRMSSRMHGWNP
jgi:hypothetical protein